jgi:UDP-N-acetylglucosamine diphosphorylase/glucosamine-1-phosphate N-acetyltransferase
MSNIGVIILAAGKGTRMKSDKPKVCFDLGGKSLIQRVVNTSLKINSDKIGIVVGFKKELVMSSIASDSKIHYVTQENQNGTGDAVNSARELFSDFSGTVFILCGDVPLLKAETLSDMLAKHKELHAKCTVLTMILDDPEKYGRIVRDEKGLVKEIIEYKDADDKIRKINEVNSGIYCFECEELFEALSMINNDNAQNEYYLTDVLKIMYDKKLRVESVVLKDISEAAGVNSQVQLSELEKEHYSAIRNRWMNNGVSMENPDTVLIQEDVVIENDVYLSHSSKISGKSYVGKDSYIGPYSIIHDSILDAGSRLEGMNVVYNAGKKVVKLHWNEKIGV